MSRGKSRFKELCYSIGTTSAAVVVVLAVLSVGFYAMSARRMVKTSEVGNGPPEGGHADKSAGGARDRLARKGESARAGRKPVVVDEVIIDEDESPKKKEAAPPDNVAVGFPNGSLQVKKADIPSVRKEVSNFADRTQVERRKAESRLRKTLDDLHKQLHARGPRAKAKVKRAKAEEALEAVVDPAAAGAIWREFAGTHGHHLLAAQMLARIDSRESSSMLTVLSVFSDDSKARFAAKNALRTRDLSEYGEQLISLIAVPRAYRREAVDIAGKGRAEVLLVEGERARYRFVYPPPPRPNAPAGPTDVYSPNAPYLPPDKIAQARQINRRREEIARASIAAQIDSDIEQVRRQNAQIEEVTGRAIGVLQEVSGEPYGPDREQWRRWLAGRLGKPYKPLPELAKHEFAQIVPHSYEPSFINVPAPT